MKGEGKGKKQQCQVGLITKFPDFFLESEKRVY